MILKLCRDVMNLEQLIQNNTVMGALTRVLQEEYKKSVDLSFNILRYASAIHAQIAPHYGALVAVDIQDISGVLELHGDAQPHGQLQDRRAHDEGNLRLRSTTKLQN
jgi:hypothetical protein